MRICYFYTKAWREAIRALPGHGEMVDVSRSFTAYWEAIVHRWGSDNLMVVEHDILIRPGTPASFEDCPNPWCVFPYWGGISWLDRNLGCTRFSKSLQDSVTPAEIQQVYGSCWECGGTTPGCWRHIDGKVDAFLTMCGYVPCVHLPPVEHLTQPVPDGMTYKEPQ